MMKRYGCLALFLVLLFAGVGLYRATWIQSSAVSEFSQLPPQTQQQRRADAQNLVKKVEEIAREAKASKEKGAKKAFVIEATEEQLNTLLQDRLRTEKFPISGLNVHLKTDALEVGGTVDYRGVQLPATVSGTLKAEKGALDYQVNSLTVGGLPAPSNLRDKVQKSIQNALAKLFVRQKQARVEEVKIVPEKITVRGQVG